MSKREKCKARVDLVQNAILFSLLLWRQRGTV